MNRIRRRVPEFTTLVLALTGAIIAMVLGGCYGGPSPFEDFESAESYCKRRAREQRIEIHSGFHEECLKYHGWTPYGTRISL